MKKPLIKVGLQIFLLISATFAFSYILKTSMNEDYTIILNDRNGVLYFMENALRIIGKIFLPNIPFASAVDADSSYSYCSKTKIGETCIPMTNSECSSKCAETCISSTAGAIHACSLGTCYDSKQGTCGIRTAKQTCDSSGGQWFDNIQGTIPQCMKACCMLNGNPEFITEQQCSMSAQAAGLKKDFRSEIITQPACLALRLIKEEGACLFEKKPYNDCIFTTQQTCKTRGGKFNENILCSNSLLNTRCLPQETTSCEKNENGEEAIYWFDSCGNKENIYDFNNKAKLRQDGKVVNSYQSCRLPSPSDPTYKEKQKTCGNCAPLLGSICGKKIDTQKLIDSTSEFVCKDASCIDETGKKRDNLESWCRYQGAIGEDLGRAIDTPGSLHFRQTCQNGEIVTNSCGTSRDQICVESQTEKSSGGKFSSSQCLRNLGYLCFDYNKLEGDEKTEQCQKNPHCFIKHVAVAEKFTFDVCVPKYKPGFARDDSASAARCSVATLSCKYVKVKGLFSSKKVNQECVTEEFTKQMNDLCMSLGDCGVQANYLGDLSKSYKVVNAPELGSSYLSGITRYANEKSYPGRYAPSSTLDEYFGIVGYPQDLGNAEAPADTTAGMLRSGSMIAGAVGSLLPIIAHTSIGASALSTVSLASTATVATQIGTVPITTVAGITTEGAIVAGPTANALAPLGGALAGAAVGFALTSFLISWTGIGRGLPSAVTYGLMALGTIAGGLAGYGALGGTIGGSSTILGVGIMAAGFILAVVVILVIVIFKLIGIGKAKTTDVTFTCKPWQPPLGGKNCVKCGSDGLPCTRSACESLGQTCELINEGTNRNGVGECVDISPDDVTPPIINTKSLTPSEYKYEPRDFGIHIKPVSGECITETYVPLMLKFDTNEPAQCKMSADRSEEWSAMEDVDGSLFTRNHTLPLSIPSLESLGIAGFDPYARADIPVYLFCQDKSGNKNSRAYSIDFCVKQGNDTTPPIILDREPILDKIRFDSAEQKMIVFTNEPTECKWGSQEESYDSMINEFDCANEIEDYTINGFVCNTTLSTPNAENNYYVRCKDQPWQLGENASKRNEMKQSYQFKLSKVSTPLKIDSISPVQGTIIDAESEPATVKLEVKTSGGLDGNAQCFLKYKGTLDAFTETFSSRHTKILTYIYSGIVNLPVICKDAVGNVAEATTEFTLKIDATPPVVTRVYNKDGILNVITEKTGSCSLSTNENDACLFDYKNGTEMTGSNLIHTLPLPLGKTSYIKCKNKFGKVAGGCSIVVQGSKL